MWQNLFFIMDDFFSVKLLEVMKWKYTLRSEFVYLRRVLRYFTQLLLDSLYSLKQKIQSAFLFRTTKLSPHFLKFLPSLSHKGHNILTMLPHFILYFHYFLYFLCQSKLYRYLTSFESVVQCSAGSRYYTYKPVIVIFNLHHLHYWLDSSHLCKPVNSVGTFFSFPYKIQFTVIHVEFQWSSLDNQAQWPSPGGRAASATPRSEILLHPNLLPPAAHLPPRTCLLLWFVTWY